MGVLRKLNDAGRRSLFALDVPNGLFADLPACGEEVFGDEDVSAEAEANHPLDKVGTPSSNRRIGVLGAASPTVLASGF